MRAVLLSSTFQSLDRGKTLQYPLLSGSAMPAIARALSETQQPLLCVLRGPSASDTTQIHSINLVIHRDPIDYLTLLLVLHRRLLLSPSFFPLAIPIPKKLKMRPHDDGVLDKFLHAVYKPVPIVTRDQPIIIGFASF